MGFRCVVMKKGKMRKRRRRRKDGARHDGCCWAAPLALSMDCLAVGVCVLEERGRKKGEKGIEKELHHDHMLLQQREERHRSCMMMAAAASALLHKNLTKKMKNVWDERL